MSKVITSDSQLAELLSKTKRVAVVGISDKEDRPSNGVSRWLQKNSHFELYFVNPTLTTVLGNPCYASLSDIPVEIDMVDIFRKVSDIPAVVDEAIGIGAKSIWIQLGLRDDESAERAIAAGRHVLMEKPPATTLGEAEALTELAAKAGVTFFATWHSRFALGVEPAKQWLSDKVIQSISIVWKEDVRRWHPGQAWIWEPGGFGVFDPGINALSILTEIVPGHIMVEKSTLEFPENKKQPIAASIAMRTVEGAPITAEFDWRQEGPQTWDITVQTNAGELRLSKGGSELYIGGEEQASGPDREYAAIYERFAKLIHARQSDTDYQPLRIVADSFLCGERKVVAPFED